MDGETISRLEKKYHEVGVRDFYLTSGSYHLAFTYDLTNPACIEYFKENLKEFYDEESNAFYYEEGLEYYPIHTGKIFDFTF